MKRSASLNSFFKPAHPAEQGNLSTCFHDAVKADANDAGHPVLVPLSVDTSFQPSDEPSTSLCLETPRFTKEVLRVQRERKENVEKAIALADEQLTFITQLISSGDEECARTGDCTSSAYNDMNLVSEVFLLRAQCKKLYDDVERLRSQQYFIERLHGFNEALRSRYKTSCLY